MIVDAGKLIPGQILECDLCIIGAGAAGITIAREFLNTKTEVCLLEAGGLEQTEASQAIYKGRTVGVPYYDLDATRLRYLGGTTNHWGGMCQPLAEIDFTKRSWIDGSGWPIKFSDLDPYYRRAHPVLELGSYGYEASDWERLGFKPIGVDRRRFDQRFWQTSPPTRFGEKYRGELQEAGNLQLVLNANVTNIQANSSGQSIDAVDFRTLQGRKARVRARAYVLAVGGIENARLLLLSDGVHKSGLGNRNGAVGRYFMEHPDGIPCGLIASEKIGALVTAFSMRKIGNLWGVVGLSASEALQKNEKILNAAVKFDIVEKPLSGYVAAQAIQDSFKAGRVPDKFGEKLLRVIRDFDDVSAALWQRYVWRTRSLGTRPQFYLELVTEQAPGSNSRVTLTDKRDALGQRRVALDLRLTKLHKRTAQIVIRAAAAEIGRLGLGRVKLADWLREDGPEWSPEIKWGNHHMGTTRMSGDPKRGVVDADCKMHDVKNLWIAGSSVFPTGGYTNPTLTIVALALRLADRLKKGLI